MQHNDKNYISESHTIFAIKFNAILEKASQSDATIFSNILTEGTVSQDLILEHYQYFIKNYNYDYHQADPIGKNEIIKQSIHESFLQQTFNAVMDSIILEGDISLHKQIMLENTVEKFNLDLSKLGINYLSPDYKVGSIEENFAGFIGAGAAGLAGVSAGGVIAASMVTSFALSLLMPARNMNMLGNWVGEYTGKIGRAVVAGINFWKLGYTPALGQSHQNLLDFDNIDADPVVKDLFRKIQKININETIAQRGLSALSAECIHQNSNILSMVDGKPTNFLDGIFEPSKYNVLKLIIKAMVGKAETGGEDYDTLLRFRKCLSNKLVDVYKLLLISNLQNKKDHARILNTITKANSDRPEQLINFLPSETDEDKQLREAILSLIMFRMHLSKLVKGLEQGFFEVDKEAGKFLDQKLKAVDTEVEQYLRLHKNKFQPPFEGSPMDRKPSSAKASILSKYSITN